MTLDLNAIRERSERYTQAIGPGGEKAWHAGLLAAEVPALLAALAAVEQDRDKLSALAAEQTTELETAHDLIIRLAEELCDVAEGICWQGNFKSCPNGGCVERRALLTEARAIVAAEHSGTEAGQ